MLDLIFSSIYVVGVFIYENLKKLNLPGLVIESRCVMCSILYLLEMMCRHLNLNFESDFTLSLDRPHPSGEGHPGGSRQSLGRQNVLQLPGQVEPLPHHGVPTRRCGLLLQPLTIRDQSASSCFIHIWLPSRSDRCQAGLANHNR